MGKFDKQLKYSIRKVSIGAASVVIGAFYLAMGAGVVHAETNTPTDGGASHSRPSPESETSQPNGLTSSSYGAEPAQNPGGLQAGAVHSVKEEMKTITRTIKYVNASDESKEVSATVTQTVTLTRKQGTEEWTTGKWEAQTSPTVNGFGAPDKSTIESKEVTSTTENEDVIVYYTKLDASSTSSTRGRRVRRETENPPAGGTSNTSTGTEKPAGSSTENNEALDSAVTERKGSTVQPNQPGVNIPKGDESGAHDPNAHISFDDPDHTATVEEMWKIIQHMPDDFQNNERTYLRNMDTLGRELRFDKTPENPEGVPLKPGEIRELHDFGGWHAIDKDGTQGKFVIGRKNEQGYFTGWRKVGETPEGIPIMEQGGMLGADALDNIYVHEQALDRRFDYMMMLVKGRTRANRNETVADKSKYDPRAQNERAEAAGANYNMLPFLEKDKFKKYSPGVVGYNGIEKKFTAFSTKYGSRVRVDFVTGYITDINGSKGSYRVVIKAQNSKGEETKVYDETISRVAEIVQNEELYKKGLNVESAHESILKFLKGEFEYRVNKIKNPKVKANSLLRGTKEKDYTPEQQKVYDQIVEEATEEAKKQGDIVMNVTEDFLSIAKSGKKDSEWKKTFTNTSRTTPGLSNDLNNLLKNADKDNPNTPTWLSSGSSQAKADNRAYRLLTTLIPGAKKITYHVNDDQLEVETDKYTYTAARNGSKEVGIQGSDIAATLSADAYNANPQTFDRENTNTKANALNNGWARSSSEEFKHFSRFIGVDKGIVRTNVISDEELSAKIKEAVGPGYSKLGKAGYFSTADIPLGPDIVSYTVQVIPSDNERVGVNPQSSRIQYNMPILADFSVIQDTVEPSKELARRIISKSNLPEDKKKEIIEKINKKKKTSEIRSAMSGNVKVRYVDTAGNVITNIKNDKTFGEKDSENRYTVAKDVLFNSTYNVTDRAYRTLSTTDKYYRLVAANGGLATNSASVTGEIGIGDKVVTFVYEERTTPPTGKGIVHFKKQVSETATEALTGYDDITLEGNVGETFSSTDVNTKITALKNVGYEIVSNEFDTKSKTIDSTTDEDGQEPSQVYNVIVRERITTDTETKPVTRTIKYVKIDDSTGEEVEVENAQPTNTTTVNFTRNQTMNLVTGLTTNGKWSENQTLGEVKTPVLEGYVADKATVGTVEVTGESQDIEEKVVYRKIGSWVPRLPEGVTPPTGTDMTPKPYPNNPDDPTKPTDPVYPEPGTPTDPNTPKPPVIPYVPGYTPKTPNGNPLVPVDPEHPEKGYKVPPVPTKPGENTPITYEADPQKVVVKVFNTTTGTEVELPAEKVSIENGTPNTAIPTKSLEDKIKDLEKRGYTVDNKDLLKGKNFDTNKDVDGQDPSQVYKLLVRERTTTDTETKPVTRTIKYVKIDDSTGEEVEVENAQPTNTTTVNFTRNQTMNLVTGLTTNGKWSENQTLGEVKTPVLEGYVADKATVGTVEVTGESQDIEEKVVYRKIGSWVPRLPEGVTPPTGTDMTPKPYPNNPDDPTKPTDPVYPEPGTPTDPNTPKPPVIPYVPGYTPKTPNGNPLVPVDPEHPEKGYKVPPVPTKPGEDTPITYEKVPDKPKPETTGTKEVTRTIKYVDEKGNELAKPSTDKVTFKGKGSDWKAVGGDSTFDAVKSPVVKGYILKDPAQKVVEKETVKSDSKDETITVTYTKVGSFVPKVPEGVTPKTPLTPTPYDNDPEDPTKVVTPNPEKPQDPNDPNSPKVPVIPQVPGHTPVVPKDPTKPVSPENPLVPLTPVDPNHPEKGYNVPPVPTIPGQDTPITYVKDGQQKATTSFVDPKRNVLETPITETGDSNTPLTKDGEIKATIAKLKLKGYDVETNTYPPKGSTFDNDPKVDQYFKVTLTPRVKPVKPFDPTDPKDPNKPVPGQPIDPDTPVDPNNPNDPTIPRWTDELIKKLDVKKEVTRTINYVDEEGNKISKPSTDKVTFTREAKINVVTGEITYGDWKAVGGDSTFDKVSSPVVKGYILKDPAQKEVAERKGITPTVANQTIEVVYKKLGSWVPKVPGVETPTPLPYPNDPTDPTKPGVPTDPTTPNVPVIPYVPGYTPKTPDGNPLVPVDPNDPTKGYIPPVPTEPGKDTPIEYVKVPNTPSPEEPVKPTPESNHITIWVDENGKPLKPEKPGTHEPGNIPGYRFITTTTKDGVTIHKFEKITPVEPNNPVPQKPTTPIPTPQDPTIPTPESQIPTPNIPEANTPTSETSRREELPNTGTEANANLAALGLLGALSGFGLLARKKKED